MDLMYMKLGLKALDLWKTDSIVTVLSVSAYAYENAQGPVKQVGYRGRSLASDAGTTTTQQQHRNGSRRNTT